MSLITQSKVDETINYENEESDQSLSSEDTNLSTDIYEINIFGNLYLIAVGNVNIHPANNKLVYVNTYLLKVDGESINVVSKIGVFEKIVEDEESIKELNHENFGIENMVLLLFQKFYTQRYNLEPMAIDETILKRLQGENTEEESKEEQDAEVSNKNKQDKNSAENDDIDDLDKGLYEEKETNEGSMTAPKILVGEGIVLEQSEVHSIQGIKMVIHNLYTDKMKKMNEDMMEKQLMRVKKIVHDMLKNGVASDENNNFQSFVDFYNKTKDFSVFVKDIKNYDSNMEINNIVLFVFELLFNVKFIIVKETNGNHEVESFSLIPPLKNETNIQDKYLKLVFVSDPTHIVFLDSDYKPLVIENKQGEMVERIQLSELNEETMKYLREKFAAYRSECHPNNKLYNYLDHYDTFKLIEGGKSTPKLKFRLKNNK
jgi:hypothetical protein